MNQAEFVEITSEIEKFYEKEYNTQQRRYTYESLKEISKERYRQLAHNIFKTSKFMPKLADLIELEKTLPREKQQEKEKVNCPNCNGTGIIIYKKLIPNGSSNLEYDYAARCNCINAEGISNEIPLASEVGI